MSFTANEVDRLAETLYHERFEGRALTDDGLEEELKQAAANVVYGERGLEPEGASANLWDTVHEVAAQVKEMMQAS